jgi:D-tyrosyl-tRNA(Tyr) deacylase
MRVVIQRVLSASVNIDGAVHSSINHGYLVLLGIHTTDNQTDVDYIVQKIAGLRIMNDEQGKMNLSLSDVGGNLLLVSQFTLYANTKKGNRPSFVEAAAPSVAIPLYEQTQLKLKEKLGIQIQTGVFGADMQINLLNDGPVTIIIDSKSKE